jgi:hypothetical protein
MKPLSDFRLIGDNYMNCFNVSLIFITLIGFEADLGVIYGKYFIPKIIYWIFGLIVLCFA